jgi:hypothetical protein
MRWVLPGGAKLGERDRAGDELAMACRPGAAVLERVRPPRPPTIWERLCAAVKRVWAGLAGCWGWFYDPKGPDTLKRVLEVLTALVALITAILALFSWMRN